MENSTQYHSTENDCPYHAGIGGACLLTGLRSLDPEKARLHRRGQFLVSDTCTSTTRTHDIECHQSEKSQHIQGFCGVGLDTVDQPLNMTENERLCFEEVGLCKSMAEQSTSLAMRRLFSEAENAERLLAHSFVDWRLHKVGLLAINLLNCIDAGERHLLGTNANGRAVLLMQFVKSQGTIARKIQHHQP